MEFQRGLNIIINNHCELFFIASHGDATDATPTIRGGTQWFKLAPGTVMVPWLPVITGYKSMGLDTLYFYGVLLVLITNSHCYNCRFITVTMG